ncbi:MAG TPA: hypothetical protein VFA06_18745 [Actinocrinis sp.]|uniref:hypothetical protein n=1 Tax=Actinocrinis sp. TaxID=1920516 RepID=UPI002D6DC343|nr:hypothetical protein [Actinocrinis sp.]HZU57919.1 hypothetical protein [Actinocrinis sp.]
MSQAAKVAALSPSSHNCQPWALAHLAGDEARSAAAKLFHDDVAGPHRYLALALDQDRRLTALAAHGLEMLLSCGLYGQLLVRALAAQGWTLAQAGFLEEDAPKLHPRWPERWTALGVLKLVPGVHAAESMSELSAAAAARCTNRAPYLNEQLDPAVLEELKAPGTALCENHDIQVHHLFRAEDRSQFARLLARHGGRDFSDLTAWSETFSFIRSPQEAAGHGDGFTLAQLFGPMRPTRRHLMKLALAPRTMRALRHLGYPRLLAGQLAALTRETPTISILSLPTAAPTAHDILRAGAYLTDYWLRATRSGLAIHPLSILLQHEDARRDLQSRFNLPGRVFFVARLGRPTRAFPRTARRAASGAHIEL